MQLTLVLDSLLPEHFVLVRDSFASIRPQYSMRTIFQYGGLAQFFIFYIFSLSLILISEITFYNMTARALFLNETYI